MEQNVRVLYQLAKRDTKLNWYDSKNPAPRNWLYYSGPGSIDINGAHRIGTLEIASYTIGKNELNMYAEKVNSKLIETRIPHEMGHSFWNSVEYPINEKFMNAFTEELKAWQKSDEQFKEGSHAYCCTSPDEMFAECYSLIVTGHAQSEYTLSKHFPRTLAVVRKMIEND